MLKITVRHLKDRLEFVLQGRLVGPWVSELRRCWESARNAGNTHITADLSQVHFFDYDGEALLNDMYDAGVELRSNDGPLMRGLIADIKKSHAPHTQSNISHSFLLIVLLSLAIFLPAGAAAQSPTTLRLTLREAVQLALKQNPQVQMATLDSAVSREDRAIARSALLPQAGAAISDQAEKFNTAALIGRQIPGFPLAAGPFQVFQAGASFSFPIFDLTLWRGLQAAGAATSATAAREQSLREQVTLLTVSQYLGCLRASANVQAAQSRVELADALLKLASDAQENGVGTRLDTLRANVQLQTEKQRLIQARAQREVLLFGLSRLLTLGPQDKVELADEMKFAAVEQTPLEPSLTRALETRPEVRALTFKFRASEDMKHAANAARLPKLLSSGTWGYQGLSANSSIPSYQYQLTVQFPLFTGGRIQAESQKARLELEKVQQQQQDLKQQIVSEVKTAFTVLDAAQHEVEVATLAVQLANEEVQQARDRFEAGVANNIEVITAQDELARADDNKIAALYRYNQALADMAHATGNIQGMYAK